jgi:hypothetical protein
VGFKISHDVQHDLVQVLYEKMNLVVGLQRLEVPRELLIYDFYDLNLRFSLTVSNFLKIPPHRSNQATAQVLD